MARTCTSSRYGSAALFTLVAAALGWALAVPRTGLHLLLPIAAVCASGLRAGIGPALLAAALAAASYPVLAHEAPSLWAVPHSPGRFVAFTGAALLAAAVTGSLRRTRRRRLQLETLLREQLDLALRDEGDRRLLSDASRLLESAGDLESTLKSVARLAATRLGGWCMVALLGSGERPRVAAVEISRPDEAARPAGESPRAGAAGELTEAAGLPISSRAPGGAPPGPSRPFAAHEPHRFPADVMAEHGLGRVLRGGEAELLSEVGATNGDAAAATRERLLYAVGVRSFLSVPMRAHGRLLGAIGFAAGPAGSRRLDERDLAVGEELARRCAFAVANAGLCQASREEERAREEALAVVSHDLRGPLSNILMASRTLEKVVEELPFEVPLRGLARSRSRVVARCAAQMTRLVDDLQDFARIEAGQFSVVRAQHAPESIARETTEAFEPMAEGSGVAITGRFAAGSLAIECDRGRIIQVLSNLLSNAIHASPRGGTVTVSVEENGDEAVFSVEDSGKGIPPDELPSIFDRYRRGRSAVYRGTGLGLAIAKKIVELHGGQIWAESAPGRGSAFRFRLPAVRKEAGSDVLIVDDDVDIRCSLKAVLELEGYHVALAANGREAWEWLQSASQPALILLDLMMPVMNGTEFLGLVRTDTRLRSVPVVLITAFGSLDESVTAQSQGLVGKPFDIQQILGLASRYCPPRTAKPN